MNWRSEVNVEPVLLNVFICKFFNPLSLSCKIMQSTLSLKCPSGSIIGIKTKEVSDKFHSKLISRKAVNNNPEVISYN